MVENLKEYIEFVKQRIEESFFPEEKLAFHRGLKLLGISIEKFISMQADQFGTIDSSDNAFPDINILTLPQNPFVQLLQQKYPRLDSRQYKILENFVVVHLKLSYIIFEYFRINDCTIEAIGYGKFILRSIEKLKARNIEKPPVYLSDYEKSMMREIKHAENQIANGTTEISEIEKRRIKELPNSAHYLKTRNSTKKKKKEIGIQTTVSKIHFEDYKSTDFERLTFAFILRERNWDALPQWLGEVGSDGGRDIWGVYKAKSYCYQCANYQKLIFTKAKGDIDELVKNETIPDNLTVVCGGTVSAKLRAKVIKYGKDAGISSVEVWSGAEFEEGLRLKGSDLIERFAKGIAFPALPSDLERLEGEFKKRDLGESELNNALENLKAEFQTTIIEEGLAEEWGKQLDEIKDDIAKFKPQTAKKRLEKLEERILNKGGFPNQNLEGNYLYLIASCLSEMEGNDVSKQVAELFIRASTLCPNNFEYRVNKLIGYYVLEDYEKVKSLIDELLAIDQYNHAVWAIKCFLHEGSFEDALKNVPKQVKDKREFRKHIFHWIATKKTYNIKQIDALQVGFMDVYGEVPESITTKNRVFWSTSVQYFLNVYLDKYPQSGGARFTLEGDQRELLDYINKVLEKITGALKGSELEDSSAFYYFQYYFSSLLLESDTKYVAEVEKYYSKLPKKNFLVTFQLNCAYSLIDNIDSTTKAIKAIEELGFEETELLYLINCFNYAKIGNQEKAKELFKKYLDATQVVDVKVLANAFPVFKGGLLSPREDAKMVIDSLLDKKEFNPASLKKLFHVLLYSAFQLDFGASYSLEVELESLTQDPSFNEEVTIYYVAVALKFNNKLSRVIEYLNSKSIDTEKPSDTLKLYCVTLYEIEGDKRGLLAILEKWRNSFQPDFDLLRMEVELRRLLVDWKSITEISELGLKHIPNNPFFIYYLLGSLYERGEFERLKEIRHLGVNFDPTNEERALFISQIFLKSGLPEESLELLYRIALIKNNKRARTYFIFSSHNYPGLIKTCDVVELGNFVRYRFEETDHIVEITSGDTAVQTLLGKKSGDKFDVPQPFGGKPKSAIITAIMDKYALLTSEILRDATNPLAGYPMQKFEFEGSDIESMNKTLVELFGEDGSKRDAFVDEELIKYYNGVTSFSNVVDSVFNRKPFDAYFNLISPSCKYFRGIPLTANDGVILERSSKYVLDVTSLCLFYQLEKKYGIRFEDKFVVSPFLRETIRDIIKDTETLPPPKLSMNITNEGVRGHVYSDSYKENRLKLFSEILNWLDLNCILENVDESLGPVAQLEKKAHLDSFARSIIDNRILSDRKEYFVLTNDFYYLKPLRGNIQKIISPEKYLNTFFSGEKNKYQEYFLLSNYVGITISKEILENEYYKMINQGSNSFPLCIENLRFSWNPNPVHIVEAIKFVKWLFIQSPNDKAQAVTGIFVNLLTGIDRPNLEVLQREIFENFKTMKAAYFEVMEILDRAAKIVYPDLK